MPAGCPAQTTSPYTGVYRTTVCLAIGSDVADEQMRVIAWLHMVCRTSLALCAALLLTAACGEAGSKASDDDEGAGAGSSTQCQGASEETTELDAEELAFIELINAYRVEQDRGTLEPCRALSRAAQGHSEDMRARNFFDHENPDGESAWGRTCAACYEHGCTVYSTELTENIAAGFSSAQGVFGAWQASSGHNKNMLDAPATIVGVGRAGGHWTLLLASDMEPSCE